MNAKMQEEKQDYNRDKWKTAYSPKPFSENRPFLFSKLDEKGRLFSFLSLLLL